MVKTVLYDGTGFADIKYILAEYKPYTRHSMIIYWNENRPEVNNSGYRSGLLMSLPMPSSFSYDASFVAQYIGENKFKVLKDISSYSDLMPDPRLLKLLNTRVYKGGPNIWCVESTEKLVFMKMKYYNNITIHPQEEEKEVEYGET